MVCMTHSLHKRNVMSPIEIPTVCTVHKQFARCDWPLIDSNTICTFMNKKELPQSVCRTPVQWYNVQPWTIFNLTCTYFADWGRAQCGAKFTVRYRCWILTFLMTELLHENGFWWKNYYLGPNFCFSVLKIACDEGHPTTTRFLHCACVTHSGSSLWGNCGTQPFDLVFVNKLNQLYWRPPFW